jgi:exodeoxyribonuclease V gamma subunit
VRADGDDVLARTPAIGDRDPRSEDRQLLLDSLLAATDRVVITYSGRNEVSGEDRPPAVVLGELLDVLRAMAPQTSVVREEPLQAYSSELVDARSPRTFDTTMAQAALAARGPRASDRSLGEVALPVLPAADLELEDLMSFLADPARAFLRQRLELYVPQDEEERGDELPIELDGLAEWQVGDRMLRELFDGAAPESVLAREWRRGMLPPGKLGWAKAQEILQKAGPLASMAQTVTQGAPASAHDVTIDLGGRLLSGTVTDIFDRRVLKMTYSKLGPKPQLEAWISLLALAAAAPGRGWSAGALGRGWKTPVDRVAFVAPEDPIAILRDLVAIYDAGLSSPLPLPLRSSYGWADGRRQGVSRANAYAQREWENGKFPGESAKPPQVAVWGSAMSWASLVGVPPLDGEDPNGEGSRLGALALRVWAPMLEQARGEGSR